MTTTVHNQLAVLRHLLPLGIVILLLAACGQHPDDLALPMVDSSGYSHGPADALFDSPTMLIR